MAAKPPIAAVAADIEIGREVPGTMQALTVTGVALFAAKG